MARSLWALLGWLLLFCATACCCCSACCRARSRGRRGRRSWLGARQQPHRGRHRAAGRSGCWCCRSCRSCRRGHLGRAQGCGTQGWGAQGCGAQGWGAPLRGAGARCRAVREGSGPLGSWRRHSSRRGGSSREAGPVSAAQRPGEEGRLHCLGRHNCCPLPRSSARGLCCQELPVLLCWLCHPEGGAAEGGHLCCCCPEAAHGVCCCWRCLPAPAGCRRSHS